MQLFSRNLSLFLLFLSLSVMVFADNAQKGKVTYIDLSVAIQNDFPSDPVGAGKRAEITYIDHAAGAKGLAAYFDGADAKRDFPGGNGWAAETISLNTHTGTHMDAPWHYAPVMNSATKEEKAWTIDQIPLDWCVGNLVVLDFSDKEDGYVLLPKDIDIALKKINYKIQKGDIVCIHTSAAKYINKSNYRDKGCGVGKEATLYILNQGINVVGTDAWSWDAPFSATAKKWKESAAAGKSDSSIIWEGHFAGIEKAYFQMEKLTNLDKVPKVGATIYCFPIKIKSASAGFVRAVAAVKK